MGRGRIRLAAVAATVAALVAGCGLGPGDSSDGIATLDVTRDYGSQKLLEASVEDPSESETVLRILDRETELETRYGGGFVQAIDGLAGGVEDGRSLDWFFYVNGIESPIGSAERSVAGGDRIWWDHHDWTDVQRVPAVVGSWPEPFLQASAVEDRLPVRVECAGENEPCERAVEALNDAGASPAKLDHGQAPPTDAVRILVGTWSDLRADAALRQLAGGPQESGVFARFERGPEGFELVTLDERGEPAARLGEGAGLVAALRLREGPATWIVGGVDRAGVKAAADALHEDALNGHYAVAVGAGADETLPLPVVAPR